MGRRRRISCLALDIGASKLGAAMVDREGRTFFGAESATPKETTPKLLFGEVAELLDGVLNKERDPSGPGCRQRRPVTRRFRGKSAQHSGVAWLSFRRRLQDRFGCPRSSRWTPRPWRSRRDGEGRRRGAKIIWLWWFRLGSAAAWCWMAG